MLGFEKKYKVDYNGQKESFTGAKDSYKAGEEVRICYNFIATDTDYSFIVDGKEIHPDYNVEEGFVISFTMPEHDVSVEVSSRNSMLFIPQPTKEAIITFDSFDGGGPSYDVKIEDENIAEYKQTSEYYNPNHDQMCGSGYDVIITFIGKTPGKTTATIECRSPIAENYDAVYDIEVNENLDITVSEKEVRDIT